MSKKLLSLFLAAVMLVLAIPVAVLPTFATAAATATAEGFTTTFSDAEDIVPENANKADYTTGTIIEFPAGWEIGAMSAATWNESYHITNVSMNNGECFHGGGGWMEGASGGGFYFGSGQLVAAIRYINETEDLNGDGAQNADDRTFGQLDANIMIRYTAPYFGIVSVDVTKLNFNNTWNAMFAILLNGEPVGQFDTADFDYASGEGWFKPTDVDSTDAIDSIVSLDVKKGDKIDFVFRGTGVDSTSVADFNYNNCKRLANDWGFSVEYEAGYALVEDMDAWANEQTADVIVNNTAGIYFFAWFDGDVQKTSGSLSDDAVLKINPYLVDNGVVSATDTVEQAFDKWVAYMKDTTKITYNSNWSMGSINGSTYLPILYHGFLSDRSAFHLDGTAGAYTFSGWDNQYWIPEAGVDAQFNKMYSLITGVIAADTVVSTIEMNPTDAMSRASGNKITPSTSTGYGHAGSKSGGRTNPFWGRSVGNKGGVNIAYTWTAPTAGYAKFEIGSIQYQDNAPVDFAVMLNGSTQLGYVTVDLSEADALDQLNALLADFEAPVFQGDQVSLVFARVNGNAARVNLTAKANLDTSRIPPVYEAENTWTGDSASATVAKNTTDGMYLFHWYRNGERVANGAELASGDVLKVNPYLIENGIVAATDTYKVAFDKWIAYVKETFHISYNNNWSMGAMSPAGIYEPILYPGFTSYCSLLNVTESGQVGGWDSQFMVTASSFEAMTNDTYKRSLDFVKANALVSDIAIGYKAEMHYKALASTSSGWATGGNSNAWNDPFWTRPTNNVGSGSYGAYAWTAPVSGVATFKVNGINFREGSAGVMPYAIMLNGVIVRDWTNFNITSSSALSDINAQIGTVEFPVQAGDQVAIVTARYNGSATRLDLDIAVSMDTTRVPVVYKKGDTVLATYVVERGEALPQLTGVSDFGTVGYLVNGKFEKTLPETVEDGLLIEDYAIETSVSVTINNRYVINVYVQADEDATGAGIIVNGRFMYGIKQEDGSYKVAARVLAASQLQTASLTFKAFQTYEDGYRISAAETTVTSIGLFEAYVNGDYDATTKALASGVLDFAEALRAYMTGIDLNATVKNHLKGTYTISGNYLSGKHDVYLGTLKQITTGEEAKYIANFKDAVFAPDPTVTEADKVKMGFEEGVDPTSDEYKYAIQAVTLNLEDQIGFAFRVVGNGDNAVADLRPDGVYALRADSGVGDYSYYDAFLYDGDDKSAKAIVVDGLPASRYDLDQNFTIVEKQADGSYVEVSATLTYSVKAYAVTTFTFGKADYASYLAQALFRLGVLADEYVAAHA
ncbi:MAG: hypothetical protein IJ009_01265 [Clostridia bacterium]|nr:hypothetical protein [Clostridia bacterium]